MKETKAVYLSTFRYVVPADYENFLEKMAAQGWNVDKIGQWSSLRMVFKKTKPKKYRYIFDMNLHPKKDYVQTYVQLGWEYVGMMASCIIWRKEYKGKRPESFTDAASLEKRNKRVMKAVMVSFFLFLGALIAILTAYAVYRDMLSKSDRIQFFIGIVFALAFVLYLGWVVLKIYKNRRR
ncbi:MAG: DUF2812 domain-containing protein [Christensenellales bacterium]